jgi:hypothetical protein
VQETPDRILHPSNRPAGHPKLHVGSILTDFDYGFHHWSSHTTGIGRLAASG